MSKKKAKAAPKRPFGMTAGAKGDRFQPRGDGTLVITGIAERMRFTAQPSPDAEEFIRRSELAAGGWRTADGRRKIATLIAAV